MFRRWKAWSESRARSRGVAVAVRVVRARRAQSHYLRAWFARYSGRRVAHARLSSPLTFSWS